MKELTNYDLQANNFLCHAGATLEISFSKIVKGFPNDTKDHSYHNMYYCKIRRNNKTYSFPFYDSTYNYEHNIKPTKYDILACLGKYPVDSDVWEFASEFGYTIDDKESFKRVSKIHKACQTQYEKLYNLFGVTLLEELQEIN